MTTRPLDTHPAVDALSRAVAARRAAQVAERDVLVAVADWADAHPDPSVPRVPDLYGPLGLVTDDPAVLAGADRWVEAAGPGAPTVSEFAIVEIAAALGRTTESGRLLVSDVMELRHRLPRLWARVEDGAVEAWRARRVAGLTRKLTMDGAAFVDAQVAGVAHKVGFVTLERLVAEAAARFDPEPVEGEACDERAGLGVSIQLSPDPLRPYSGTAAIEGTLDAVDALDLEQVLDAMAAELAERGCGETVGVRRALALGLLARGQGAADLYPTSEDHDAASDCGAVPERRVVLYVHLSEAALAGAGGFDLARVATSRADGSSRTHRADQVAEWCGSSRSQVVVKPVIDLAERVAVDAYEVPDRIGERVRLSRTTCAFPHCGRDSIGCDLDHTIEYDPGGPPGQTATDTVVPLCRRHHRVKTHASPSGAPTRDERRWRYRQVSPGHYLWTSPHGRHYLVDPDGTTALN